MKMNCDAFRRKVNVMLTYTGITKKRVAEKLGVPSNSFNAELFNCISGKKQERIIDAIYDLAGPALAEDLKELETTLDYLEEQHG